MMQIKKKSEKANIKEHLFCLIILVPFIVQFLIFWLYANFTSIRLAFTYYNPSLDEHVLLPIGRLFENFIKFITELSSQTGKSYILNGAYYHLINVFLCLPFSYMIAYVIYKKLPGTGFFKVMLYLPQILSSMVTVLVFKHFIESGIDGLFLQTFDKQMPYLFQDIHYNRMIITVYMIYYGLPGALLINLGTMSRVPPDLIEYGKLEGITMWKEFTLVVLPLMFPLVQVQCLGLFSGLFTAQGPLFTFYDNAAPENLQSFGYYMYISIARNDSRTAAKYMFGYTSAANLTIGLVSVPIVQLTKKLFDRLDPEAEF